MSGNSDFRFDEVALVVKWAVTGAQEWTVAGESVGGKEVKEL